MIETISSVPTLTLLLRPETSEIVSACQWEETCQPLSRSIKIYQFCLSGEQIKSVYGDIEEVSSPRGKFPNLASLLAFCDSNKILPLKIVTIVSRPNIRSFDFINQRLLDDTKSSKQSCVISYGYISCVCIFDPVTFTDSGKFLRQ